jgi:hypothetical protein
MVVTFLLLDHVIEIFLLVQKSIKSAELKIRKTSDKMVLERSLNVDPSGAKETTNRHKHVVVGKALEFPFLMEFLGNKDTFQEINIRKSLENCTNMVLKRTTFDRRATDPSNLESSTGGGLTLKMNIKGKGKTLDVALRL